MKYLFFVFLFCVLSNSNVFSQINDNFQSWTSRNTYGTWTQTVGSGTFSMTQSIISPTGVANGSGSVGFVQLASSTTNGGTDQGKLRFPSMNTCGTLTLNVRSSGSNGDFFVEKSTNGGTSWTVVQSFTSVPTVGTTYTVLVNEPSSSVILRINGDKIGSNANRRTTYVYDISTTLNNNTNCSTVTSLSVPVTVGGTTTTGTQSTCGKTNDYPDNSFGSVNYGNGEDAVWSITVPSGGGNYQFDLGGTATWKILSLHSSCTPSNSNVLNYSTTSSGSSTMFTQQLSAGTYYLWIDTWPNPTCGEYSILITKLSNPPVNDEVSGAIDLVVNDPFISGTNVGSTSSTTAPTPTGPQYFGQDVWYKVTVPSNGIVQIDTDLGGLTDMVMEVYSGTISSLTYITFNDDSLSTVELMPYIEITGRTPGETIYIRLWDYFSNQTGTFSIKVLTPISLPVELIYFEGKKYSSFNLLQWSTASEYNSNYFQIEESTDGEIWKSIGIKSASGNSNSKIDYSYSFSINNNVIHYYKLRQFDFDGQNKVYGPISIDNTKKSKEIVKLINILGQEVNQDTKGLIFEVYEDGTMEKIIR